MKSNLDIGEVMTISNLVSSEYRFPRGLWEGSSVLFYSKERSQNLSVLTFFFPTKEIISNHLKALNKTGFFEQDSLLGQKNQMVFITHQQRNHTIRGSNYCLLIVSCQQTLLFQRCWLNQHYRPRFHLPETLHFLHLSKWH